jgi:arginase
MPIILAPWHLDEHLPNLVRALPAPPDVTVEPALPAGGAWRRYAALHDDVATAVCAVLAAPGGSPIPVVVSGDCLVSLGVVAGVQRAGIDAGVLWFDAHGDVQTVETTASGYPGGMPLRILAGSRPPAFAGPRGLAPIAEDRLALVGARDLDPPEIEYLARSGIRRWTVAEAGPAAAAGEFAPMGSLVLHVDLDVVDAAALPGLRYPVTPGPTPAALLEAVAAVLATGQVVAVSIAATWFDSPAPSAAGRDLLAALFDRVG